MFFAVGKTYRASTDGANVPPSWGTPARTGPSGVKQDNGLAGPRSLRIHPGESSQVVLRG